MSSPIISLEDISPPHDDTPTIPAPSPALTVPLSDAAWDAAASAGDDAIPDLPDEGTGNGKFCEVCGKALTGKQRRFCAEHSRNTTTGTGSKPRATRRGWKDAGRVESNLTDLVTTIAGGLLFLPDGSPLQKDGDTLYKFGPKVAHELVVLADDDPRMRKILERLAAPGKYGPLVIALGGLALGLAANHGLLPKSVGDAINAFTAGGES